MTNEGTVRVTGYLAVFGVLLFLTGLTVAASTLNVAGGPAIAIGLTIAATKATLVALFFMHLIDERRLVYLALLLTGIVVVALFALTLWTEADHIPGSRFTPSFDAGERPQ